RQRVRGGERRPAHRRPRGARIAAVRGHRRPQHRRPAARAHVAARPDAGGRMNSLAARRAVNWIMTGLCALALAVALVPLVSLLWLVVSRGFAGLRWSFCPRRSAPGGGRGAEGW